MTRRSRWIIAAAVVIALPFAIYFGARVATAFFAHGYTLADMDWNGDGRTTLAETIQGSDVGERRSPNGCREFFAYKDARPIKTVCPSGGAENSN